MKKLFLFILVQMFITFFGSAQMIQEKIFLLEAPNDVPFNEWRSSLKERGITLAHSFPPIGGIVILDNDNFIDFSSIEGVLNTRVYYDLPSLEDEKRLRSSVEGNILFNAFKKLLNPDEKCEEEESLKGEPLINDALIPLMESEGNQPRGTCTSTNLKYSGSEYMLGNVSVNVILPESNGAIDTSTENWSSTMETSVSNGITQGLNELRNLYTLYSSLEPSFTYHYYYGRTDSRAQTSYEPINRSAAPSYNNCSSGEGLWACQILDQLGYSSFSGYTKAREFNGDARNSDGTDWAYTIFVVNSLNDSDGKFPDGYFGYAWVGGPWVVMTYDNDGWGISNMNKVSKHESGHIFYAFDEYSSSSCTCSEVSGYINYQNQNCENSCSSNVSCMMRDNVTAVCSYTKGQLGWGDLDSDTIPDPVDINPETTLTPYSPDPTTNTNLTYTGTATIQKLTNHNVYNYQCDINILTIANVQFRVDGGSWQNATASDGSFNSSSENYTFTTGTLSNGTHTIETRAVDEVGQADTTFASDTVTVNAPSNPPGVPNGVSGNAMTAVKTDTSGNTINLTWDNSCAGSNYSIVVGGGSGLPTSYSGTYTVSTSLGVCNLGSGGSYTWNNTINPSNDSSKFYWFLVVATDSGKTTEGSWGKNSGNIERKGPGTNGSSGQCSITNKNVSNSCGQ